MALFSSILHISKEIGKKVEDCSYSLQIQLSEGLVAYDATGLYSQIDVRQNWLVDVIRAYVQLLFIAHMPLLHGHGKIPQQQTLCRLQYKLVVSPMAT